MNNVRILLFLFLTSIQYILGMEKNNVIVKNNETTQIFIDNKLVFSNTGDTNIAGNIAAGVLNQVFPVLQRQTFPGFAPIHFPSIDCTRSASVITGCNNNTIINNNVTVESIELKGKIYTHFYGTNTVDGKSTQIDYYVDERNGRLTPQEFARIRKTPIIPNRITPYEIEEDQNDLKVLNANLNSLASIKP